MRDLRDLGLKSRLPHFISGFLSDRKFKVPIGSTLSDMKNQKEGVPQGSVLSLTLFWIKINNITKCLTPGVDNLLICYRSKYIHAIERKLQQCLDNLNKWATENGFRFSQTKTKCVHFCYKRKLHNDPCLKLERTEIPVVNEHKFLGLVFDKKLTIIPHLKYLWFSCNKRLQLLRVIAHTEWGADRGTLLKLYRSLIRSKLDSSSFIYQSAKRTYLDILNPICHGWYLEPSERLQSKVYMQKLMRCLQI